MTGLETVRAGSRTDCTNSSELKCERGGGKVRRRETVALPGLAVGLRAEVARPPAPIHDLRNRLAPIRGHDLALALDHDPIRALSPEAGAGPAPLTAARGRGRDHDPSRTPRGGGAGPSLAAPLLLLLLVWAPALGLPYQNQDLEKKIKAIKCW